MKTLAVVTMFFLPGSFISALFSTPMFDWDNVDLTMRDSIGVPLTPQFRLYWSVTVPLTLVTFILYFLWLWYQAQEQHKAEEKRNKQLELGTAKVFESKKFEGVTEVEKQERARRVTVVDEEVGVVEPWKKTF